MTAIAIEVDAASTSFQFPLKGVPGIVVESDTATTFSLKAKVLDGDPVEVYSGNVIDGSTVLDSDELKGVIGFCNPGVAFYFTFGVSITGRVLVSWLEEGK